MGVGPTGPTRPAGDAGAQPEERVEGHGVGVVAPPGPTVVDEELAFERFDRSHDLCRAVERAVDLDASGAVLAPAVDQ
ncbi:MAG: hypothetical protein ACXVJ7_05050 [Acidimicrobiia bacterium]